ncbi:hypothetical protein PRIPAC_87746 [Pristionchus pacificus]|uniref:Uncharacterized protein n=1 Tax=Pristionchus pacificus TaxID=54126 RepID=A0A454Y6T7_PRIPA|nr:hypothetical protein PRIPAC_87746 [Pristionchus pacificus]|eukprot:PDM62154.1 hypothetical protein PRIPAC_51596 [Pristionchus pacificus]
MFLRLLSLLALSCTIAAAADSAAGGIPNLSGNVGLTGAGYGDAYGGKVSDGVYGAGGRVGGNLGLTGLLGLGRKKRQDFGFVPFSSLNIAASKPAEPTAAPGGRRKRQATANANATATANGGNASAVASAVANAYGKRATTAAPGRKRRQIFGAMPIVPVNAPGGARPILSSPVPVATAAPTPTTGKPN